MESRVKDFFNEINEIVPPVTQVRTTSECVWQECFDDTSGYPYYWNMLTNTVTWEIPPEYQAWLDKTKTKGIVTNKNDFATKNTQKPPGCLFPSMSTGNSKTSLYESKTIGTSKSGFINTEEVKKIKIVSTLVDNDYDSREASLSRNGSNTNSPFHSNNSKSNPNSHPNSDTETDKNEVKPTLGFSLLANYGNYSDESDDDNDSSINNQTKPELESIPRQGHSTLFPFTKPIDVKQFQQDEEVKDQDLPEETEEIDVKAFKRKRRIGVHLVNHPKRDVSSDNTTKSITSEGDDGKNDLKKKFGMTFVKGDTLQPHSNLDGTDRGGKADDNETESIVEAQTTIKEKLAFLSEGREQISPVQVMSIQLEILFVAYKSGNLNSNYFISWIKEVSSDLIKLEEDATPEGWNLEWDRKEKRYFYRNKSTNECQWQYPQEEEAKDTNGDNMNEQREAVAECSKSNDDDDDDAMDICTTPPPLDAHADGCIEVTTICASASDDKHNDTTKIKDSQDLNSVLDSFYSDIAAIETAETKVEAKPEVKEEIKMKTPDIPMNMIKCVVAEAEDSTGSELPKKKKKVKMSHGIAMKKKGVSQLVEKWKNVRKEMD